VSQDLPPDHISKRTVVYRRPGVDAVRVRRDEPFGATESGVLAMDLYYPPDSTAAVPLPAVIIVGGFPDAGYQKAVGCVFKEMGSSTSWARLMAASGLIAVAYTNQEPVRDSQALLEHIRRNAGALGIDENRIGLWASSGNVPLTLWLLMQKVNDCLKCAVLCYGFTLDSDESTAIAEAARTWGFVNPCAGRSVKDVLDGAALFIARAGQDRFPRLNEGLDRFLAGAVHSNLPVTFVNHAAAPHAFDLFDDSLKTRDIIRQILAFLRFNLLSEL